MHKVARRAFAVAALALCITSSALFAQGSVRIQGTIVRVDGRTLVVKSRDGAELKVTLADNVRVSEIVNASLADIKQGSFVGVAGIPQPDGTQKAIEVQVFPESMRGTGEGYRPGDLAPNSTLTNATVDAIVAGVDGQTLTMKYRDGEKRVVIHPDTPIVAYKTSDKSELRAGATVLILTASRQPDGTLQAQSVSFKRAPPDPISKKLREFPGTYNKPGILFLGSSTPVQYVIQTAEQQSVTEMFKGFAGDVTTTPVQVAENVSAQLTGPKDMVEIILRGEPMRTITKAHPITWIWDVRPLRPGQAQVVLEVFSDIKIGTDEKRAQIRVLQDTWTMEAKGLEWVKYQILEIEPIRAFIFFIVSGVAATLAYFGVKGRQTKKSGNDDS